MQKNTTDQLTVLHNGESLFFSHQLYNKFLTYKIFPKHVGLDSSTKNLVQFTSTPYLLDKFATAYIHKHQIASLSANKAIQNLIEGKKFKVYEKMVDKYYLLNGHKFGCDFLVYEGHPEENHAKYLLFIEEEKMLAQNHISRLSNMCKKVGLVARVGENISFEEVKYERGRERIKKKNGDKEKEKKKKRDNINDESI